MGCGRELSTSARLPRPEQVPVWPGAQAQAPSNLAQVCQGTFVWECTGSEWREPRPGPWRGSGCPRRDAIFQKFPQIPANALGSSPNRLLPEAKPLGLPSRSLCSTPCRGASLMQFWCRAPGPVTQRVGTSRPAPAGSCTGLQLTWLHRSPPKAGLQQQWQLLSLLQPLLGLPGARCVFLVPKPTSAGARGTPVCSTF